MLVRCENTGTVSALNGVLLNYSPKFEWSHNRDNIIMEALSRERFLLESSLILPPILTPVRTSQTSRGIC